MEMGQRVGTLIKAMGISKAKFAQAVGTSASRISNVTTGRNKPDALMLERIMTAFADRNVNPAWLLTGQGDIFITPKKETEEPEPTGHTPSIEPAAPPEPVAIPQQTILQQDATLLTQRMEYLERENKLLKGFLQDLRLLMRQQAAHSQE